MIGMCLLPEINNSASCLEAFREESRKDGGDPVALKEREAETGKRRGEAIISFRVFEFTPEDTEIDDGWDRSRGVEMSGEPGIFNRGEVNTGWMGGLIAEATEEDRE